MERIKKYILNQLVENKLSRDEAKQLLTEANEGQASNDIAIIGVSCQLPGAKNKEEYWKLLSNGKSAISSYSDQRLSDFQAALQNRFSRQLYFGSGGENEEDFGQGGFFEDISRFDAAFFSISPREAKFMDPYHRLFLESAWEAVEDAGYGGSILSGSKTGVFVGRDHAEIPTYQLVTEHDELHFTGSYSGILASRIAYLFNWQGPCVVMDTACSSGLVAVHTACRSLQANDCSMAVAGGIKLMNKPVRDPGLKMIESKDGSVRAFDKDASGTMISEGVGIVVLKTLKQALQDNDHIYAVIKGSSINNDGASTGLTAPNVNAQYEVITNALQQSKIPPETISYIEAHGTGTVLGDPIEFEGLSRAFRKFTDKKQFCGIGSVKTNIGHTVGASGIAGLIKIILSMQHKVIPASLNFREANPYIDFSNSPFYVVSEAKAWEDSEFPRRAGISSFGFSGTNCHIVVEEAASKNLVNRQSVLPQTSIFTLSAKSKEALIEYVRKYVDFFSIPVNQTMSLEEICFTAAVGRGHYTERLAIIVSSVSELKQKLLLLIENDEWNSLRSEQIYYGKHRIVPNNKKVLDEYELSEKQLSELNNEMLEALEQGISQSAALLCDGYVSGANMDWRGIFAGMNTARVSLPTYPYERKRYWAEALTDEAYNDVWEPANGQFNKERIHRIEWVTNPVLSSDSPNELKQVLLFTQEGNPFAQELVSHFERQDVRIIKVVAGSEFQKVSETDYRINVSRQENYQFVFESLKHMDFSHILYLFHEPENGLKDESHLNDLMEYGVYGIFRMVKAMVHLKLNAGTKIVITGNNVNCVTSEEQHLSSSAAALQGFARVIEQEYSQYPCSFIDYDETTAASTIINEILSPSAYYACAYRDNVRFIPELKSASMEQDAIMPIKEKGLYLITGGLGGIGLQVAGYLASLKNVHLILASRRALPERMEWESLLEDASDSKISDTLKQIIRIEELGSKVTCLTVDVTDAKELEIALQSVREEHGKLNGVIHAAGLAGQGFIINKSEQQARGTIGPKVNGTFLLDKLTQQDELDFFVLFSSVISLVGGHGQADYAAGNSFIDTYAANRRRNGRATQSVNWGMWSEVGMAVDFGLDGSDLLLKPITNKEGLQGLAYVLQNSLHGVLFGELNPSRSHDIGKQMHLLQVSEQAAVPNASPHQLGSMVKLAGKPQEQYTMTESALAQIWGHILEMETINVYDNFYELGGDSIMAIKLVKMVNEHFSANLNIGDVLSSTTFMEMSELLVGYEAPSINSIEPKKVLHKQAPGYSIQSMRTPVSNRDRLSVSAVEHHPVQWVPEMDEFAIKQNVTAGDNYLSWKQMNCYARGLMYMMRVENKPITKYFKLLYALRRAFDIHHPDFYHMHLHLNIQYINEYLNEEFCKFVRKFGFEIEISRIENHSIHRTIQGLLNEKKLVMVMFDEYYLYYSQYYLKRHSDHHAVIYGYDNKRNLYHILNHNHINPNNGGDIEYGPFIAPFSLIEEMVDEADPARRFVVTIAKIPDYSVTEQNMDTLVEEALTLKDHLLPVNRVSDYVRKLLTNQIYWNDNSADELFDYMGAAELLVDTLQQEFGCTNDDLVRASNEMLKYTNLLLKKYLIKIEAKSILPDEYMDLLNKIDKSTINYFTLLEKHFLQLTNR